MTIQFQCASGELTLKRWPLEQPNLSLQAWDAADELLLQQAFMTITALQSTLKRPVKLLIINDSFGALSCALSAWQQVWVTDSYLSELGCRYNRQHNVSSSTAMAAFTCQSSLAPLPTDVDLVLLKLPTNHSLLHYQLQQLASVMQPHTQCLASAKAKDIHKNVLALFAQLLGPASASLTVKKCRLITCTPDLTMPPSTSPFPLRWPLEDSSYTLVNHANAFSREKLDIGARFLLQHLPEVVANSDVIDLGCGNGVLGLMLLAKQPQAKLLFTDESFMAIASAKATIKENLPESLLQCQFVVDDCLTMQPENSTDWVICNPPFHQHTAVTTHIASQMFSEAKRVLRKGGRLRIVANRHLAYQQQLTRLFGHCQQLAANPKFVILEAIKRS